MPNTQRHKRPADVISNAVQVMKLATGEDEEELTEDGKNKAAVALGSAGGHARAKKLGARRRKEIAKKAAAARWKKSSRRSRANVSLFGVKFTPDHPSN